MEILVRYILVLFGLSLKYKTLDQCLSGLIISSLTFLSLMAPLSLTVPNENVYIISIKIFSFSSSLLIVWIYILLKKRIEKFYGMYDEISEYFSKITGVNNKYRENRWSTLALMVCSSLCYISTLVLMVSEELNKIIKPLNLKISLYHHIPLTGLCFIVL